jgi:ABC transport system ATP-binding/permease protein
MAPNVLILDEPTNDLDVQTLSVLEEYLEEFNGCVIVVSHDRYFLDRTVNRIFAIEPGGTLQQYPGNYSVYLEHKKAEEQGSADIEPASKNESDSKNEPATPEPSAVKPSVSKKGKLSYKEKRELEQLEAKIPAMEAEKQEIEKTLYHKPPSGFTEVKKLSERLAELNATIDTATERWLELSEVES